ncbi:MAG: SagB/ThcOx family dehydrogenase [Candidatus Thiodiazotropha sp.]
MLKRVRDYHERTKHRLDGYAAGPDFLDWDQQPNPFRRFAGAPLFPLPLDFAGMLDPSLGELDAQQPCKPLSEWGLRELSSLLRHSLGLAAWKVFGPDRWSLRCNPSSGNLHPTEGYLILRGLKALKDGVYHYAPYEHALECRCQFPEADADRPPGILLGLSSIAWREAWKYGERAYRYVHLDLGHAIGALAYAAATQGYRLERLDADEDQLAALMGLDREPDFEGAERERPDLLMRLLPLDAPSESEGIADWMKSLEEALWQGRANTLSPHPCHRWPLIDEVAAATPAVSGNPAPALIAADYPPPLAKAALSARSLILQRRSAQAFSGKSSLPRSNLFTLLDCLLPRATNTPWNSWPYRPSLHLALFIHRVDDLAPGLYLLARSQEAQPELQRAMREEFLWEGVEGAPAHLPFYRLVATDAKRAAHTLSYHQEIAASSFFSLGMLAEFEGALQDRGPRAYPELFWEAGLIGQVLYLQAEAAGVRGTGIGCFFDDAVHEILGLKDARFQSLYHFTVGLPKPDNRLQTLPPYDHLLRS